MTLRPSSGSSASAGSRDRSARIGGAGSHRVQSGAKHKTMPFRCRACRKRFSVRSGTVMQHSNLGYQVWAMAIYLFMTSLKSVSSMKLHRDLNIAQNSAWHLSHRIRAALFQAGTGFAGPVEVDENLPRREAQEHAELGAQGTDGPWAGGQDGRGGCERSRDEPSGSQGGASHGQANPAGIRAGSRRPASDRVHGRGESLRDVAVRA